MAGNQFVYCNRLRASDYFALFEEVDFNVWRKEVQEDKDAWESMRDGFRVDEKFGSYSMDDLCVTPFRIAAKIGRKNGGL